MSNDEYRDALWKIVGICEASPNYSRRTQSIHNAAMLGLGLTKNQRDERYKLVQDRADGLKRSGFLIGLSKAKKEWKAKMRDEQQTTLQLGV